MNYADTRDIDDVARYLAAVVEELHDVDDLTVPRTRIGHCAVMAQRAAERLYARHCAGGEGTRG